MRSKKKKKRKRQLSSDNIIIVHVSSLTTGSPLQKQQEKVKSRQLNKIAFSLTSKVPEPSAFHFESSKQVPFLGLLPRGCRPKSRPLLGHVEVIQPVVRACTTFWLTCTRITLTRVHNTGSGELLSWTMDRIHLRGKNGGRVPPVV